MEASEKFSAELGTAPACRAFGVPRATLYRRRQRSRTIPPVRKCSHRALSELHGERFVDQAPAQVWASLLDENIYLCSIRTMYRILEANQEVRERRNQLRHLHYEKPELLAPRPNEVWSWDITKLKGPRKWSYFSLYVMDERFGC